MEISELRRALSKHLALDGYSETESSDLNFDLAMIKGADRWGLALCSDREEGMAYLGAFEAAMQKMVDAYQAGDGELKLGLGVAFGSAVRGQHPSYRRALKKYSNSIVFDDLGLHLFLVQNENEVMELEPAGVNLFLRNLDRWIALRTIG